MLILLKILDEYIVIKINKKINIKLKPIFILFSSYPSVSDGFMVRMVDYSSFFIDACYEDLFSSIWEDLFSLLYGDFFNFEFV